MKKKFTSTDIARCCGCSQATVSRVLNNYHAVDVRTRAAVLACARANGYPVQSKHGKLRIGIILSRSSDMDAYRAMALNALKYAINRHGCQMEIIFSDDLDSFNDRPFSGAIAVTGDPTLNQRWSETTPLPLVRFGAKGCAANGIYSVFSDESTLVERAVHELADSGHRRIALFLKRSCDHDFTLAENVSLPFRKAMKKYLPQENEVLISYGGSNIPISERMDMLLKKNITALIVIPGDTALELCAYIRQCGLSIPEDISLICREYDHVLEFYTPPLTAMRPDYAAMSEAALAMLESLIRNRTAAVKDIRIPGSFIRRGSVCDPGIKRV